MAVCVLGSATMERLLRVARLPSSGETVLAEADAPERPGGRGLSQAVAAARAGSPASFIGRVGRDPAGEGLCRALASCGVDITGVGRDADLPSGRATLFADGGQGSFAVVEPGANRAIRTADAEAVRDDARVFLAQLETPIDVIAACFATPRAQAGRKILNAAPLLHEVQVPFQLADMIIFSPRAFAFYLQLDREPETIDELLVARRFLTREKQAAVVMLGGAGAAAIWADRTLLVEGRVVEARAADAHAATRAEDAFCGYVAAAVDQKMGPQEAMRMANVAAALAAHGDGSADSIPLRETVDRLLS